MRFDGRILAVVSSPFQLMGLLCLIIQTSMHEKAYIVLVLEGSYPNALMMKAQMEKEPFFNEVVVAERRWSVQSHLGADYVRDSRFHKKRLHEEFATAFPQLDNQEFDVLLCSCAMRSSLLLKQFCAPHGKTIFIDDGAGSRSGMVFHPFGCFDRRAVALDAGSGLGGKARSLMRVCMNAIVPRSVLMNIQGLCLFGVNDELRTRFSGLELLEIRNPSAELDVLNRIFSQNIGIDRFSGYSCVFFTLPGDVSQVAKEQEQDVLRELDSIFGDRLLIKLHPRRDAADFLWCGAVLGGDVFWELSVAAGAVTEEMWLIGSCSTAQSSVKMLFGLEPRQVLLHHLIDPVSMSDCEVFESDLREAYQDRMKIHSPTSLRDLSETLKSSAMQHQAYPSR